MSRRPEPCGLVAVLTPLWDGHGPYDDRYRCDVPALGIVVTGRATVYELCRALVEAGVPDQPMTVHDRAGRCRMLVGSIHSTARWTVTENIAQGLRATRHQPFPSGMAFPVRAGGQKQGVNGTAAPPAALDPSTPMFATPGTSGNAEGHR